MEVSRRWWRRQRTETDHEITGSPRCESVRWARSHGDLMVDEIYTKSLTPGPVYLLRKDVYAK
jgi:hypothetical protein